MQLAAPAAAERGALLKHEIEKRSLLCSDDILLDIASSCDGYDAYDLVFGPFSINLIYDCYFTFLSECTSSISSELKYISSFSYNWQSSLTRRCLSSLIKFCFGDWGGQKICISCTIIISFSCI